MVKAHTPWPCPQQVAWQSPYLNCFCAFPEPSLWGHSAYPNPTTCVFPAAPSLKTNEVQGFLPYPYSEPNLKETHTGAAIQLQNANPESLQKKLLIFDQSGNKTRLFYSPVLPLVHSPIVTTTQFAQVYDLKEEEKATDMGQKNLPKYCLTKESDEDRIVNVESEMHEDTEEINALLYSDDSDFDNDDGEDDEEVTSTGHSPLVTKRTCVMREQFGDSKEEVGSSDWPNKRQKYTDGDYDRSPFPAGSAGEYASDAESKYSRGDNSMAGDIQSKKDKIRETLRVLENIVPGAKGKHPLSVIDGTIEYLESLITQTGTLGLKF